MIEDVCMYCYRLRCFFMHVRILLLLPAHRYHRHSYWSPRPSSLRSQWTFHASDSVPYGRGASDSLLDVVHGLPDVAGDTRNPPSSRESRHQLQPFLIPRDTSRPGVSVAVDLGNTVFDVHNLALPNHGTFLVVERVQGRVVA